MKENKMGTEPINKLLLSMSIPIIISMLVQACYNIVDSIFVAKIDSDALNAVTLVFPIQMLMMAVITGLGVGVNARLSKALGERKYDKVNKIAMQGIFLTIIAILLFLLFGAFGSKMFINIQTNRSSIVAYGIIYCKICTMLCTGLFLQVTFEKLLQSTGKTTYTMITQLTGAIINLILDPILIFGLCGLPKMGISGAAIATVFGQFVAGIMAFYFNIKKNNEIKFIIKNLKPNWKIIQTILSTAIPSILMISIGSIMTFSMNKILAKFSVMAVTIFGIYFKLQSFIFMPVFGLNNGMIPIIAYNYGARKKVRVQETIKLSSIYATSIMLVGVFVFHIFPKSLIRLFLKDSEAFVVGVPALRIISISFIFAGFCIVIGSVCQAMGLSIYSLITSVVRQLVILVPVAYLMSLTGKINLVWTSFPIAEMFSLTLSIFFMRKTVKEIEK